MKPPPKQMLGGGQTVKTRHMVIAYENKTREKLKSVEKGHGRIETRECYLCDSIDWLPQRKNWAKLHGAGVIIAKREIGGEITV